MLKGTLLGIGGSDEVHEDVFLHDAGLQARLGDRAPGTPTQQHLTWGAVGKGLHLPVGTGALEGPGPASSLCLSTPRTVSRTQDCGTGQTPPPGTTVLCLPLPCPRSPVTTRTKGPHLSPHQVRRAPTAVPTLETPGGTRGSSALKSHNSAPQEPPVWILQGPLCRALPALGPPYLAVEPGGEAEPAKTGQAVGAGGGVPAGVAPGPGAVEAEVWGPLAVGGGGGRLGVGAPQSGAERTKKVLRVPARAQPQWACSTHQQPPLEVLAGPMAPAMPRLTGGGLRRRLRSCGLAPGFWGLRMGPGGGGPGAAPGGPGGPPGGA